MAVFKTYEEIEAWQIGRQLVRDVYALTRGGNFAKDFGLKDQIQRAAVSVCSNIAEGFERRGNKEFIKFLWYAKGSAAEVSSQLYHAEDLAYITHEQFVLVYNRAKAIAGMLHNLIKTISLSQKGLSYVRE